MIRIIKNWLICKFTTKACPNAKIDSIWYSFESCDIYCTKCLKSIR